LGQVELDTYFVAGLTDHIVPWESAYKGALLFGGQRRFVLSKSGHIQALVNPPSPDSRSSYQVIDELPETPEAFSAQAPKHPGSWWPDWDAWLARRASALKNAPETLGNSDYKPRAKAPGTYVLAN
jgi:polyhydroxyalkanoate synthase